MKWDVNQFCDIAKIPGIRIGQEQDTDALTGCTVIIAADGAVGGVDQRGGSPGTRETDLLRPMHMVEHIHAVLLTGGSAFGLDAAAGVMKYLEENKIGFNTGVVPVPIVPAAVLFDLAIGDAFIRPDLQMGYQACVNASLESPKQGNFGAGCGATVGKIFGMLSAMKSGIGHAALEISSGIFIGAIVAVNAFGDVIDPSSGDILAGARPVQKGPLQLGGKEKFANTLDVLRSFTGQTIMKFASSQNTTIGAIVTNARLTKEEANKVAQMGQNGLALTINPAHTMMDGDTLFTMATGKRKADVNIIGAFAPMVVAQAIINAVTNAEPVAGLPSYKILKP
ncbi:MAG: P1 family peptidase [Anaerolineaceae bacterium]